MEPTSTPNAGKQISGNGLAFVKKREAYRAHLYDDATGNATIGYGHLVHRGRVGTDPAAEAPYLTGLTELQASQLLLQDLTAHASTVRSMLRPLSDTQFDALVSLAFNIGVSAFLTSTLRRRVEIGNQPTSAIAEAFMMWDKPHGVIGRRLEELTLFLTGRYS